MHSSSELKQEAKAADDTIVVYGLDFDGCMAPFAIKYLALIHDLANLDAESSEASVIKSLLPTDFEKGYLAKAILEKAQTNRVLLMDGSLRQDLQTDARSRCTYHEKTKNDTGSVFNFLWTLEARLKTMLPQEKQQNLSLDKFVLPDLYHNKDSGTTFDQALAQASTKRMFPKTEEAFEDLNALQIRYQQLSSTNESDKEHLYGSPCYDLSKITLLYAQIHQLVEKNPGKKIEFNFYDDNKNICEAVIVAFAMHPELLPNTVTLNVHLYGPDANNPDPNYAPVRSWTTQGTNAGADKNLKANTVALDQHLRKNKVTEVVTKERNERICFSSLININKAIASFKKVGDLHPPLASNVGLFKPKVEETKVKNEDLISEKMEDLIIYEKIRNYDNQLGLCLELFNNPKIHSMVENDNTVTNFLQAFSDMEMGPQDLLKCSLVDLDQIILSELKLNAQALADILTTKLKNLFTPMKAEEFTLAATTPGKTY